MPLRALEPSFLTEAPHAYPCNNARMHLQLSVLDQSAAAQGRGQDATLRQSLALAEKAEAWGYHRFWVSEHHSHPSIVGSAPEVLMAAIAART